MQGVDVSHWNDPIAWPNLDPAITFVIIKATDGNAQDPFYGQYLAGCRGLALQAIGAYHYFEPNVATVDQFNNIVATVNLQPGDLPIAVDVEDRYDNAGNLIYAMSPADVPNVADLVSRLVANYGFYPMLYTSAVVWNAMGNPNIVGNVTFANCPLWVAHDTNAAAPAVPLPWVRWRIWQFSENGAVNGITGNADLNRTVDDLADIRVP